MLYYYIDDNLCKARGIDYDFDWLVIDHFCEPINDGKDWVIAVSFSIYRNW